jgi:DNA-binding SARP family transcriptional activator
MPNALRVGLLGPLQVRDGTGRPVHVGGRQLRVLLTLLALNAGRVVPAGSLAGQIWPGDPPGNPGNALQTLVSRLRAELRQAGIGDVIESHPAGYRLAVPPDAIDVMAFEALAAQGRRALAGGDAGQAARVLRDALLAWRGQPLADAAGCDFADAAAAKLTETRSSILADRIEADLALGEGASLVGELRVLVSADPLAERPAPCSCAPCTRPAARPRPSRRTARAVSCWPISSGWTRPPISSRSILASCGVGNGWPP